MNAFTESLRTQAPLDIVRKFEDFPAELLALLGYGESEQ
jgi:hypothetical protein